jgi:hypothetical protein
MWPAFKEQQSLRQRTLIVECVEISMILNDKTLLFWIALSARFSQ